MTGLITIRGVVQWNGSTVSIGVPQDNDRLDHLVRETLGLRDTAVLECEAIVSGTTAPEQPFVEITIRVVEQPVGDERSECAAVTIDGRKWDGSETVRAGSDATL